MVSENFNHVNSNGEILEFSKYGISINENNFRDYIWKYSTINNRITGFYKECESFPLELTVNIRGRNDYNDIKNMIYEHFEQDIINNEMGYFEKDGSEAFLACRILGELSRRMSSYFCGEDEFPHEVGVLLGYPTEDVEDYIRLEGREFLFVGYWKVYHNEQRARKLFAAFDEARETTVREVLEGKELYQLCGGCAS